MKKQTKKQAFEVVLLGIVFNPKTKKILIGKRENDHYIKKLSWSFPGGRADNKNELEKVLKRKIKKKTGLEVENLGAVFAKIYPEKKDILAIYYLCEVIKGKEKAGDDLIKIKWVAPEKLEKYFTTSFHPHLKEYILNLK